MNSTAGWAGGSLTAEGALAAVSQMNQKRELHEKLDLFLESSQAEVAAGILNVLYEKVVVGIPAQAVAVRRPDFARNDKHRTG